ncbi:MAG: poly(A) polymerase, partial [Methylobacterium brachiatum]|nr:poly(A) polymerase [Methylobacterium brachiatum]
AGLPAGPAIGRGLAAARSLWLELGCPMDAETRATLLERALASARA